MKNLIILLIPLLLISCSSTKKKTNNVGPITPLIVKKESRVITTDNKCNCNPKKRDDCITISYKSKKVDTITKKCFRNLVKASEIQNKLIKSEKKIKGATIKVSLEDDPWILPVGSTYTTYINIIWLDKDKNEIKRVRIKAKLRVQKERMSKWRIWYRNVMEYVGPAGWIALIIVLSI